MLKTREIDDIIIFGSFIKGKKEASDIDVAVIFNKISIRLWEDINRLEGNYHFSKTKYSNIFEEPMFWQTLIHEGYSLNHEDFLSNILGMNPYFLFEYRLDGLDNTKKQTFSHALYGTGGRESFLKTVNGEKFGNMKVLVPLDRSEDMRSFFDTWKLAYTVRRIWL